MSNWDLDTLMVERNRKQRESDSEKKETKDVADELDELKAREQNAESELANAAERLTGKADYKDSTKLPPAMGGNSSSSSKKKEPVIAKKRPVRQQSEFVSLRSFPSSVLKLAQREFPEANTKSDAIAAFILVNSNEPMSNLDVPDSVRELVKSYSGNQVIQNTSERLEQMNREIRVLSHVLKELELGVGYLIFDRLGFRQESTAGGPGKIDMTEDGLLELLERLRSESVRMRTKEQQKNGRPIR